MMGRISKDGGAKPQAYVLLWFWQDMVAGLPTKVRLGTPQPLSAGFLSQWLLNQWHWDFLLSRHVTAARNAQRNV